MRLTLILTMALFTGCAGTWSGSPSGEQTSGELTRSRASTPLWWQQNTTKMTPETNPWEAFIDRSEQADPLDPWADYKHPALFPKGWKGAKKKVGRTL